MADELFVSLQESVVTTLAFISDPHASLISSIVEPSIFEEPFKNIVSRCLDYRKRYNKPPGLEHIDDIFDHVLGDPNHKQYGVYNRLLRSMVNLSKGINSEYVASRVSAFVKEQRLKAGIFKAAARYQQGGDELAEDVERILLDTVKSRDESGDHGFSLDEIDRSLRFLERESTDTCSIGIKELDAYEVKPTKKELLLFMAGRGKGKSQFLHHIGKSALLKGWRILHYTLENSAEVVSQRYFQTLFSGAKRHGDFVTTRFEFDDAGDLTGLSELDLSPDFFIEDRNETRSFLKYRIEEWRYKLSNLRIRSYGSGQLTIDRLESDLDILETVHRFIPDLLMVDYPQMMKFNRTQEYIGLDDIIINLRGRFAVNRNLALVCPAQPNRAGEKSTFLRLSDIAGDIGMAALADNAITYSQTEAEERLQLARLFTAKVRNDKGQMSVLISQHYPTAQFCVTSALMTPKYRDVLKKYSNDC